MTAVEGWGAAFTVQTRLEGHTLAGWHTLRLSPGLGTEKQFKKKKSLHFNPPSTEQSILHVQKFAHPYLFVASLAVLSSRRKMLKGLGKKNVPV